MSSAHGRPASRAATSAGACTTKNQPGARVSVEASAIGAELGDPRPYLGRWRVELDAVCPAPTRSGDKLVARICASCDGVVDAPVTARVPQEWREERRSHHCGAADATGHSACGVARQPTLNPRREVTELCRIHEVINGPHPHCLNAVGNAA